MPFKNPLTAQLYEHKRNDVLNRFPFLNDSQHILSFESYYQTIPQKYYNKEAYNDFYKFLCEAKITKTQKLAQLLKEREDSLSLAINNLETINSLDIHNDSLPKDYDLSLFINENIHFNLLKLWESPFYEFVYLVASISREERCKPIEGLDLFNVVEELKVLPVKFKFLEKYESLYNNTIRNGIGHGKVDFFEGRTKYTDKKGKSIDKANDLIIALFDDLVDTVNGFCFALSVFYLTNNNFLNRNKINTPNAIMLKELIVGATAPKWQIKACLDSIVQDKKYLNIFIETGFRDLTTLKLNIFHTGILAAELTNKYNTISLHLKNGLSGLAMFNADKIRNIKTLTKNPDIINYADAYLKDSELLFFMRLKSWKLIQKVSTWIYVGKILFPIYFKHFYKKFNRKFNVISTYIHSKKWYNVVEAKVVLDISKIEDAKGFVEQNYKYIINEAVNEAKRGKSLFSKLRLFPAKFVTVQLYTDNVRTREWRTSKTKNNQICSLRMNNTSNIKIPIAFPNHTNILGNYTILWNSYLEELEI